VCGCVRKYELSKKGVIRELFFEIVVFLVKKGSYKTFNTVKIWKMWKKIWKIRKTWSMTKKEVLRNFGCEDGNLFLKRRHSEILVCEKIKKIPSP